MSYMAQITYGETLTFKLLILYPVLNLSGAHVAKSLAESDSNIFTSELLLYIFSEQNK